MDTRLSEIILFFLDSHNRPNLLSSATTLSLETSEYVRLFTLVGSVFSKLENLAISSDFSLFYSPAEWRTWVLLPLENCLETSPCYLDYFCLLLLQFQPQRQGAFAYILQGAAPLTEVWAPPPVKSNITSFCTSSLCHLACLFILMLASHALLLCLPCPPRLSDPQSYYMFSVAKQATAENHFFSSFIQFGLFSIARWFLFL